MPKKSKHEAERPIAIQLRTKSRLGTKEIQRRTGVPISTLHYWLRDHPLTKVERSNIIKKSPRYVTPKKELGEKSVLAFEKQGRANPLDSGVLGESGVQYWLALRGLCMAKPVGEGDVVDLYVRRRNGQRIAFIQARVAAKPPSRSGLPTISLRRYRNGKSNRFQKGDFHFLIGFCRENGKCYIYSYDEVAHLNNSVTVREEACDAWHKLETWLDAEPANMAA